MTPIEVSAPWEFQTHGLPAMRLTVTPPPLIHVTDETCPALPPYDAQAPGWRKGYRLKGVETDETTTKDMLVPNSVGATVLAGVTPVPLERGQDFDDDNEWGTLGRLPGGRIATDQTVRLSYQHALSRLNSVIRGADGRLTLREGAPHVTMPMPPNVGAGSGARASPT